MGKRRSRLRAIGGRPDQCRRRPRVNTQQAALGDPTNDAAFAFLRDAWGVQQGNWEKVVQLVDQMAELGPVPAYALAEAERWLTREHSR